MSVSPFCRGSFPVISPTFRQVLAFPHIQRWIVCAWQRLQLEAIATFTVLPQVNITEFTVLKILNGRIPFCSDGCQLVLQVLDLIFHLRRHFTDPRESNGDTFPLRSARFVTVSLERNCHKALC